MTILLLKWEMLETIFSLSNPRLKIRELTGFVEKINEK